jgi:hypothetical protein
VEGEGFDRAYELKEWPQHSAVLGRPDSKLGS